MEPAVANAYQQRLAEKEHVPSRNGEAMDKVEAEDGWIDHPAAIAVAAGDEEAETNQHHQQKAGACGTVEPTISLHFAPDARLIPRQLNW
jgi:hypothetical protein